MNSRLRELLTLEGLNSKQFADKLGIQASNVSHIMNGRNRPGYDFIIKTLESFPRVSPDWLLLGHGEMYRDNDGVKATNSVLEDFNYEFSVVDGLHRSTAEESKHTSIAKEPVFAAISETGDQSIEQIIILYKDGSFKPYTPKPVTNQKLSK